MYIPGKYIPFCGLLKAKMLHVLFYILFFSQKYPGNLCMLIHLDYFNWREVVIFVLVSLTQLCGAAYFSACFPVYVYHRDVLFTFTPPSYFPFTCIPSLLLYYVSFELQSIHHELGWLSSSFMAASNDSSVAVSSAVQSWNMFGSSMALVSGW